jgi:hypothetical protein
MRSWLDVVACSAFFGLPILVGYVALEYVKPAVTDEELLAKLSVDELLPGSATSTTTGFQSCGLPNTRFIAIPMRVTLSLSIG